MFIANVCPLMNAWKSFIRALISRSRKTMFILSAFLSCFLSLIIPQFRLLIVNYPLMRTFCGFGQMCVYECVCLFMHSWMIISINAMGFLFV